MTENILADWQIDELKKERAQAKRNEPKSNGQKQDVPPEPPPQTEAAGLGEWDAGDDTEPPPPRGWLLGNTFCRGFLSSLLATGAVGKTAVRYVQLLSLAINRSLTGEHVFQRCRVLIVSLEDDDKELRRRILAARLHYGITPADVKGYLFLACPGRAGGKLITIDKHGNINTDKLLTKLKSVIVARKIDIVYLDPFVKTHGVGENDNKAIDAVAELLTELCTKHNIAVDAPHHTSKGPSEPGNADRGRGASAYKDAGRLFYTAAPMTEAEAKTLGVSEDERKMLLRIDNAKTNIVPPSAKAKWFKLVGVRLGNATAKYPSGDEVQTVEPWTPPDLWADLSVDLINRILSDIDSGFEVKGGTSYYSEAPNAGKRAAWRAVVKHAPQKKEGQAREIIKAWLKNELLTKEDYHDPEARKSVPGLRVNNAARPS